MIREAQVEKLKSVGQMLVMGGNVIHPSIHPVKLHQTAKVWLSCGVAQDSLQELFQMVETLGLRIVGVYGQKLVPHHAEVHISAE